MKLIRLVDTDFSDQSAFETIYFQDEKFACYLVFP